MPYLVKPKKRKPRPTATRRKRQKVYNNIHWQKLRQAHLMEAPLCELCQKRGIITPAEDVHHIESFMRGNGEADLNRAFSPSNVVSLCKRCHAWLHREGKTNGLNLEEAALRMDKEQSNQRGGLYG